MYDKHSSSTSRERERKKKNPKHTFWDHLSLHTVANASSLNTFTNSWSYVKTYASEKEETWEKWR